MQLFEEGTYKFYPDVLVEVRSRLRLSQVEMARSLKVPPNTLSRWETGKTTPDAHSLAAIYTVAQKGGLNVNFFRYSTQGQRNRLVVVLDFQNLPVSAADVPKMDELVMRELDRISPSSDQDLFKAFCSADQGNAAAELRRLKWRVRVGESDLDTQIVQECKSDCGHNPDDTILVICSKDGDFAGLVEEMRGWGVLVYVMGPHDSSLRLREAAGYSYWIQWPYFTPNALDSFIWGTPIRVTPL